MQMWKRHPEYLMEFRALLLEQDSPTMLFRFNSFLLPCAKEIYDYVQNLIALCLPTAE